MKLLRHALGIALRDRRKVLRLSQEALAERLDLHRNYVSLVERGVQNITIETLFKLADVLGCRPSELLADAEAAAAPPRPEPRTEPRTAPPANVSGNTKFP